MDKIVVVNGQAHKGSTYHMGKLLVEAMPPDSQVTEFFLPTDLPHFCLGCYACIEDPLRCPFSDQKQRIMSAIEDADILVFTTPNYCMGPSASLKAFMDLTFTWWVTHRPRACMYSKRAVVLSTTAGMGASQAVKPVARMLTYWGISDIHTYGTSVQAKAWSEVSPKKQQKIQQQMGKIARHLNRERKPQVSLQVRFLFMMMRGMQKSNMGSGPAERMYWQQNGWLGTARPWGTKSHNPAR